MLSDTSYNEFIRIWRFARMTTAAESLGYPRINILIKALMGRGGRRIDLQDGQVSDADIVQTIVNKMPDEMRTVYEAKLLCLIRGERCIGIPHAGRAIILGIPKSTYWHRYNSGVRFVKQWLGEIFDTLDQNEQNQVLVKAD